jgi:hypothetical protein
MRRFLCGALGGSIMGIWGTDAPLVRDLPAEKQAALEVVTTAYRSIYSPVEYLSLPITSGKLMYEVFGRRGVKSIDELAKADPDALVRDIIKPNIAAGVAFAEQVRQYARHPLVVPSIFEARKQRWSQDEYMFLWFRVIEERAKAMHMMEGWQYGNGSAEEFVRAMEMQHGFVNDHNGMDYFPKGADKGAEEQRMREIRVYAHDRKELRLDDGAVLIGDAIQDLRQRGFTTKRLFESLHKLYSLQGYFLDPLTPVAAWHSRPYETDWRKVEDICRRERDAMLRALSGRFPRAAGPA